MLSQVSVISSIFSSSFISLRVRSQNEEKGVSKLLDSYIAAIEKCRNLMLYTVRLITESVNIPLVADIDTRYGNPLNVIRTVTDIVNMGVLT